MTTTTSSYPVNPEAVQAMKQFLEALGLDLTALGMEKTPYRVAEAFGPVFFRPAGKIRTTSGPLRLYRRQTAW